MRIERSESKWNLFYIETSFNIPNGTPRCSLLGRYRKTRLRLVKSGASSHLLAADMGSMRGKFGLLNIVQQNIIYGTGIVSYCTGIVYPVSYGKSMFCVNNVFTHIHKRYPAVSGIYRTLFPKKYFTSYQGTGCSIQELHRTRGNFTRQVLPQSPATPTLFLAYRQLRPLYKAL